MNHAPQLKASALTPSVYVQDDSNSSFASLTSTPNEPTNKAGVFVGVLFGLIFLVCLCAGTAWFIRNRKETKEKRRREEEKEDGEDRKQKRRPTEGTDSLTGSRIAVSNGETDQLSYEDSVEESDSGEAPGEVDPLAQSLMAAALVV